MTSPPFISPPFLHEDARPLCAEADPEQFFPEKGASPVEAKRVCGRCELRDACAAYAIPRPELAGVWGGTTPDERQAIRIGRRAA